MPFSIRPGFRRTISVTFTKDDGSAGNVEGTPTWELSDQTLALLTPAADGMSADMQHNGAVGDVMLTMRADGDLGAGVHPIVVSDTVTMIAPLGATVAAFTVGEEVPIA